MIRHIALIMSLAVAVAPAQTNDPIYTFSGWEPGTYNVQITIGEGGSIVHVKTLNILAAPKPDSPPVVGPDPEDPKTPLVEVVEKLTSSAPSLIKERRAIAELLKQMAGVPAPRESLIEFMDRLFVLVKGSLTDETRDPWVKWMEDLNTAGSSIGSLDDLQRFWLDVSKGMAE